MVSGVILYVGRDHALVHSRRLILEQAGYAVDLCDNTEDFVRKFLGGDYELVLLCNSLRDGERERLTSLVHRFSRSTRVLLVCSRADEADHAAERACTGEPRVILDQVAVALQQAAEKRSVRKAAAESEPPPARSRARTGS